MALGLFGPPIPGAPWARRVERGGRSTFAYPGNRGGAAVVQRPWLPRVPKEGDERRLARFTEKLSQIVNSLIGQGALNQTGPSSWNLSAATSGLTGTFGTVASGGGGGSLASPLTTKGDLWGFSGLDARVPVGSDAQVLTADSSQALGLKWATPTAYLADPTTTKGDLIVHGSSTTRLPVGSDTQLLVADSTQTLGVKWATVTSAGGASTADHYLVGQGGDGDGDLANKVVIPGLSASPDIRVAGANDSEFDTTWSSGSPPSPWSTFGTLSAKDFNVSAKSHCYLKATSHAGDQQGGVIMAAPASFPYTVTAKLSGINIWNNNNAGWLFVSDSSTAAGNTISIGLQWINGPVFTRVTWSNFSTSSGATGFGTNLTVTPPCYLRFVVHSAANIDMGFSYDGHTFATQVTGKNFLASAGYVGLAVDPNNADTETFWDWIRFS